MCYPSVPGVGHSVYSNEKRRGRGQTSLDTNSQLQDSGSSRDAASVGRPRNFSLAVSVDESFSLADFRSNRLYRIQYVRPGLNSL